MSEEFFVRREGRIEGPWDAEKLRSEVRLRKLGRYHELSADGENWQKAGSLDWLFPRKNVRKVVGGETKVHDISDDHAPVEEPAIWHVERNGEQEGPLTLGELRGRLSRGELLLDDAVWRDGWDDWKCVEEVPELLDAANGSSGEYTDATRLVESPSENSKTSTLALASCISGGLALIVSCVPLIGLVGIGPAALGAYALIDIRKSGEQGRGFAIGGIVLGSLAFLFAIVIMILGAGILTWQSISDY